jgi:hypothetical protein
LSFHQPRQAGHVETHTYPNTVPLILVTTKHYWTLKLASVDLSVPVIILSSSSESLHGRDPTVDLLWSAVDLLWSAVDLLWSAVDLLWSAVDLLWSAVDLIW